MRSTKSFRIRIYRVLFVKLLGSINHELVNYWFSDKDLNIYISSDFRQCKWFNLVGKHRHQRIVQYIGCPCEYLWSVSRVAAHRIYDQLSCVQEQLRVKSFHAVYQVKTTRTINIIFLLRIYRLLKNLLIVFLNIKFRRDDLRGRIN
jgi:hypothetical protein